MVGVSSCGRSGRLGVLFARGSLGARSDAELLEIFADGEGVDAETAFEVLVVRHGPDVLKACRRVLSDANDAEDAFQATFLVLARRASSGSIGRPDSLGPWLHGVARRVARKARVAAARRRRHETMVASRHVAKTAHPDEVAMALREEVERLPEPLRTPVVLCYLEGLTYEAAARRLSVSESTIRGRLVKARSLLRSRLARREDLATFGGPSRVPPALVAATIRAARALAAGGTGLPAAVAELMEGVLRMTLVSRWILGAVTLAAIALAAGGGASLVARGDDKPPGPPPAESKQAPRPAPARDADPDPPPTLTLEEALQELLSIDLSLRANAIDLPLARTDVLLASVGLRSKPLSPVPHPAQYDTNISNPPDISFKRSSHRGGAKTIAEAQYLDAVRLRVDALYSAYVDVQEMNERIELQKQWDILGGRLMTLARDLAERGLRPESDGDIFMHVSFAPGVPVIEKQGDQARRRRRILARLIQLESVYEANRLRVEPITPVTALPPASDLVRLALEARPDLVAVRLGLKRAEEDLQEAQRDFQIESGDGDYRVKPSADTSHVARARLNLEQTRLQLASLEASIKREVEQRHEQCASSLGEQEKMPLSPRRTSLLCQELEGKYAAGNEDANGVRRMCIRHQMSECRHLERLVTHRRSVLALNTAVGVRLFP